MLSCVCMILDLCTPHMLTQSRPRSSSLTKFLHFAKLRSLTHGSEEFLLLEKSTNPLKHTQSVTAEFAAEFLTKRRVPLADDDCTTPLFDKPTSGWLAWDKTITGHVLAPFDSPAFEWDPTSQEALGALREAVQDPAWWKKVGATSRYVVKSIADAFSSLFLS